MKARYTFVWVNGPRVRRTGVDIREFKLWSIHHLACLFMHLLGRYGRD